jgi:hypothetical protein
LGNGDGSEDVPIPTPCANFPHPNGEIVRKQLEEGEDESWADAAAEPAVVQTRVENPY